MPSVDNLFSTVRSSSASASARFCRLCKHAEVYKYTSESKAADRAGSNQARGRMIQHIKEAHPEQYKASLEYDRANKARRKERQK